MFDWLLSLLRKKQSSNTTPKNTSESEKPIKAESKPAEKVVTPTEATAPPASQKVSTPEPVPPVVQATPTAAIAIENSNVPQDSMLRRHYLTNLRAMITALNPAHPTESTLSRHYDVQIATEIERCLNDEVAMAQLISHYEAFKKTSAPAVKAAPVIIAATPDVETVSEEPQIVAVKEEPQAVIEPVIEKTETVSENVAVATPDKTSKIPEDSALRRHYIAHLYAQIQANLPPRPTDATLRRHYDAMVESEIKKQLAK